jgi:hypothetical protein
MSRFFFITSIVTVLVIAGATSGHAQDAQSIPPDVSRLLAQRDAEIKKINQRCVVELERLKVSYTKRGDLKNAVLVDNMIKEMKVSHPIVGSWTFDYRGNPRSYTFNEDGSVSGAFLSSGGGFKGIWKADGNNVVISSESGEIIANVSMDAADRCPHGRGNEPFMP